MDKDRTIIGLLFLIVVVSAVLRLWGISHRILTDENKVVTPSALLANGEQKPLLFPRSLYPHLYHYVLSIAFLPIAASDELQLYKTEYVTPYLTTSRVITALLGTATVLVAYYIGRFLNGSSTGLVAAAFLATLPLHVKYSHYTHVDLPLTFMTALTFLSGTRLWQTGSRKWYFLTGVAVGLSASVHYPGFALGIILLIAHGRHVLRAPHKIKVLFRFDFLIALLLIPLAFVVTSPYFVLDWRQQLKTYQGLNQRALAGDLGYTRTNVLWPLYTQSPDWGIPFTKTGFLWGVHPLLFVLAVGGSIIAALKKRWDVALLCGGTALVLYLSISGYIRMTAVKRLLPITPLLSVLGAYAMVSLTANWRWWPRFLTIIILSALVILPSTWHLMGFNAAYTGGSTHHEAVLWAQEHIPEGSTILQHTPLMLIPWSDPRFTLVRFDEVYASHNAADPEVRHDRARSLEDWITNTGVEFIALDSRIVDRYYEPTSVTLYPETTASYQALFSDIRNRGIRIYEATPALWYKAGPRVEIYDVRHITSLQ